MLKNKCKRCGKCCQYVTISRSPEQLKKEYNEWVNNIKIKGSYSQDIFLIYPMLRYKENLYIYECVHFKFINGKSTCEIDSIKPRMCSGFPKYNAIFSSLFISNNPSQYKGCGFNKDKNAGVF